MKKPIYISLFLVWLVFLQVWPSPAFALPPVAKLAYEKVESVQTRPGISVDVLVMKPDMAARGVLLTFPGQGVKEFGSLFGVVSLGPNFVVRTAPQYIQQGYAVAIMNEPSDDPIEYLGGRIPFLTVQFRMSTEHAADVQRVVDYLARQHGFSSFYLLGTSRGTFSMVYLATVLKDPRVKGYITTSGFKPRDFQERVPLETIQAPVLIVHHANDRCSVTPWQAASDLKSKLVNSSRLDLIKVFGESTYSGERYPGFECGYYANHGFYGMEEPVTQAIGDWCDGKAVPAVIGSPDKK